MIILLTGLGTFLLNLLGLQLTHQTTGRIVKILERTYSLPPEVSVGKGSGIPCKLIIEYTSSHNVIRNFTTNGYIACSQYIFTSSFYKLNDKVLVNYDNNGNAWLSNYLYVFFYPLLFIVMGAGTLITLK